MRTLLIHALVFGVLGTGMWAALSSADRQYAVADLRSQETRLALAEVAR